MSQTLTESQECSTDDPRVQRVGNAYRNGGWDDVKGAAGYTTEKSFDGGVLEG